MKSFEERVAEDRRLVILRALEHSAAYESNESLITMVARDFGHVCSRDQIRTDLAWLKEQRLVTVEEISDVWIATLTHRGLETAAGIIVVPGVNKPSPRS